MYDLPRGKTGAALDQAYTQMLETPVSGFNCPSRRSPGAFAWDTAAAGPPSRVTSVVPTKAVRSDYAANAGVEITHGLTGLGTSFQIWEPVDFNQADTKQSEIQLFTAAARGVIHAASEVNVADVRDGTSHTLLIGEKYLNPDNYQDGKSGGDNESMYVGDNQDVSRWVGKEGVSDPRFVPHQDRTGFTSGDFNWGGPHSGVFLTVFCDGSVHGVSYDIDMTTLSRLGNRKDGLVLDSSQF